MRAECYENQREVVPACGSGYAAKAQSDAEKRSVENEDIMEFLIRFDNGAIGTIGTSRIGMGRKLGLTYEIQGTKGSLFYTQERMNEIKLYRTPTPIGRRAIKQFTLGQNIPDIRLSSAWQVSAWVTTIRRSSRRMTSSLRSHWTDPCSRMSALPIR